MTIAYQPAVAGTVFIQKILSLIRGAGPHRLRCGKCRGPQATSAACLQYDELLLWLIGAVAPLSFA